MVDVCNACSLAVQLPFGLYDADRIAGDIVLWRARPGEEYEGIRKAMVHLAGRPTLFDNVGPFGNPTSDWALTMVTTETVRALVVVFAPLEIVWDAITDALTKTAARVRETTGGVEEARQVLSGSGAVAREGRA
jgi:DNA/RNA-binding domain of Phe-tRNA-synthetase-like protein